MKRFKVLISAITLALVASAPLAQAQQKKGALSPEQQIERYEDAVGSLSDDQKSKIKEIIVQTREQIREAPKEERREKMMELMKEQRAQIRAVLNDEQQEKFDASAPGRGQGKGGGKKKKKDR